MKKALHLISFIGAFAFSQHQEITGFVLNETDSLPLPYVNIYSNEFGFGTITNEVGEYTLNYPDSIQDFEVTVSSLGFLTKTFNKQRIPKNIYLPEESVSLDEVVLSTKENNIQVVLDNVYKNIKNNYSNKRHLLKAFYRQTNLKLKDSNYLRLIEADVGIQEYGILKALDRDRIKIYQLRKSDDKSTENWSMWLAESAFGSQNYLVWAKRFDFVKNFVKHKGYANHYKNILDRYQFEFLGYKMMNGDLVAVYNFYKNKYKISNLKASEKSKLYVNLNDYAIIKVVMIDIIGRPQDYTTTLPNVFNYTKIGTYYYLNSTIRTRYLSGKGDDKEYGVDQLFVYQVLEDRKDYKKIKRKEKEELSGSVYDKNLPYNAQFWETYIFLPSVPLEIRKKQLIEQEKNLEQQFLDNG